jgi:low temperature requirement protein LtrA
MSVRDLVRPTDETHRVTTLELFSDLVFVFALTQVTAFLATDPSAVGALRGLVLLMLLWFCWSSFAWLGNQAAADEGLLRFAVITAMATVFVAALAIPEAYADRAGGAPAPVVFAAAYAVLRLLHAAMYLVAAGDDRVLRRTILVTLTGSGAAIALLLVGAVLGPPGQTPLWVLALTIDYLAVFVVARSGGWPLPAPGHFSERHGLVVLIALGESIVAVGVGAEDLPLSGPVLLAAVLGLLVSTALWWTYFDVVALVAERVLSSRSGTARSRLARDSYTYLHFPMIVGIVFLALGLKKVLEYVADTAHHSLGDALHGLPAWALYGGVATYLLAHIAFRLRNVGSLNVGRLVVAVALLALVPVAEHVPALAALGMLALLVCALVAYEVVRFAPARDAIRHAEHGAAVPDGPADRA